MRRRGNHNQVTTKRGDQVKIQKKVVSTNNNMQYNRFTDGCLSRTLTYNKRISK
jgi:hypothetical protein